MALAGASRHRRPMKSSLPEPVVVAAVDDHPHFLAAVQAVVEATPGFVWAGGAASGEAALAAVARDEPDLVLVDVNMPNMDGFELTRHLHRAHPQMMVALVSAARPDELRQVGGADEHEVFAKENLRPAWLQALWREHLGNSLEAK